jgi:hypothetical protein
VEKSLRTREVVRAQKIILSHWVVVSHWAVDDCNVTRDRTFRTNIDVLSDPNPSVYVHIEASKVFEFAVVQILAKVP